VHDEIQCVWALAAQLGEGPCWSASEQALWFVDIKRWRIHRFRPDSGEQRSWPAPDQVTFLLPRGPGSFVVGLPGRLASFMPATGEFVTLVTIEHEWPRNRTNDACLDAAGRLWFGTMDDQETEPHGRLYCWDGTAPPQPRDDGYVISNGPAFSPDGRTFYHTDTKRRVVYRFDVAPDGTLSGKQTFVEIEAHAGSPDGSVVDAAGCIWVALYGGWAVRRYSPQGHLLRTVSLPCANVTKVAFGGDDFKTAFVSTARKGLSPEELAAQPLAGGLFAFKVDAPGLPLGTMAAG
jgi:xylono-1,5-lactonase